MTQKYHEIHAINSDKAISMCIFTARCYAERGCEIACRPSVCLSVTFRYSDHIRWNSSKIISRPNSLRPMRSLTPNMGDLVQWGEHPKTSVEWGWSQEHIKAVISPKRCKIGPRLLLRTNRKSHMRFRLAPNSSTLDDLERRKRPARRNKQKLRRPP